MLTSFLAAVQFLSVAPPLIRRAFTEREMGQAAGYYPLVGALIGTLLYGVNYGLAIIASDMVRGALVLALWVLLTGALHMDGFLDACDGILGGFNTDQRLKIMRDERVGAFGLVGGVLLLLLKFTSLSGLPQAASVLILIPTLSRWGMVLAIYAFPYARLQGLGRLIKAHTTSKEVLIASLSALAIAWWSAHWLGIAASVGSMFVVWSVARFMLRRIPGLTGDIYGAINELVEVTLLLVFSISYG